MSDRGVRSVKPNRARLEVFRRPVQHPCGDEIVELRFVVTFYDWPEVGTPAIIGVVSETIAVPVGDDLKAQQCVEQKRTKVEGMGYEEFSDGSSFERPAGDKPWQTFMYIHKPMRKLQKVPAKP